jgi:excisionase family DNA binding protein
MSEPATNGNGNGHITRHTPIADLPELITVAELASWLGVGRGTAYGLIATGEIKSVKLGRLVRVPKVVLQELAR